MPTNLTSAEVRTYEEALRRERTDAVGEVSTRDQTAAAVRCYNCLREFLTRDVCELFCPDCR